ncbi:hypothetical protein CVIRNUC_001476 [Coccomyxa viridis]|uniref:Enoyl reductase (ER) domain-containing protein n=1 Tax=Coccomyxa viridis TaxID=1274662 RepID=A0AAV1HT88_9CHLO|nr:hypothetical protein CVIRNUC_001476 [Coccomyxa viridis]
MAYSSEDAKGNWAVIVTKFDRDDPTAGLELVKRPIPSPKAGEALVRILYRPINPSDIFALQGQYAGFQPQLPAVPGLEGMGVIEEVGASVRAVLARFTQGMKQGQRVVGAPWPSAEGEGTWQQYVVVKVDNLFPVRSEVSNEDASQFFVNPCTVVGMVHELQPPAGSWLLQNAANSVLGQEIITYAKHLGIKTINVVRQNEYINELKQKGADVVLNSNEVDIVQEVRKTTGGKMAWGALNPIGGPKSKAFPSSVRTHGTVEVYSLIGEEVLVPMSDLVWRDIHVKGFWLNVWLDSLPSHVREKKLKETMDMMAEKVLAPPPPSAKYPLVDVKKAVSDAQRKSGREGKVLLEG